MNLYTLIRISTGEIQKRDVPEDQRSLIDLDPDLEYLLQVSTAIPDADPRYYVISGTETVDRTVSPAVVRLGYATVKRQVEEITVHVENREATELARHMKATELNKLAILGLFILFRKTEGLTLTTREQQIATRIGNIGTRILQNDARARQILADITAGNEPNLDAGWQAPA